MAPAAERRTGLGKGLGALIPQTSPAGAAPVEIPISHIKRNPYQPRQHVEQQALEQLAASIAVHGVLQPVLVTETLDGYQLVAGERRVRAAQIAGLDRVPAIVRQMAAKTSLPSQSSRTSSAPTSTPWKRPTPIASWPTSST